MMFMKQIFIEVALMLRFGRFADFGYRRQRRTLGENDMFSAVARAKADKHFTDNPNMRNGFSRSGFKSFAEAFSAECYRFAGIPKRFDGISIDETTNTRRSSKFSLFIRSTTAAFSTRQVCPFGIFPLPLSVFFENSYPVRRTS